MILHIPCNDNILKSLNNKFTLAYLQFMAVNLGRFVCFNTLFQSGIPVLYLLISELKTLLTSLSDFMKVYINNNDVSIT